MLCISIMLQGWSLNSFVKGTVRTFKVKPLRSISYKKRGVDFLANITTGYNCKTLFRKYILNKEKKVFCFNFFGIYFKLVHRSCLFSSCCSVYLPHQKFVVVPGRVCTFNLLFALNGYKCTFGNTNVTVRKRVLRKF